MVNINAGCLYGLDCGGGLMQSSPPHRDKLLKGMCLFTWVRSSILSTAASRAQPTHRQNPRDILYMQTHTCNATSAAYHSFRYTGGLFSFLFAEIVRCLQTKQHHRELSNSHVSIDAEILLLIGLRHRNHTTDPTIEPLTWYPAYYHSVRLSM